MNHIVLYQPEIPQNTGNIMRTCLATNTKLHLIEPLGFQLDEKSVKRSGANYVKDVNYVLYKDFNEFLEKNKGEIYYLTRYGLNTPYTLDVKDKDKDYYFVLGKESTGIPKEILRENLENCIRIPTNDKIRSLNVSNVAAVAVFEALRQQNYEGLSEFEPDTLKGKEWLLKD